MSVDVGDAVELTFETVTGATVTITWNAPDGTTVLDHQTVTESPASSGKYPTTLVPDTEGMWQAIFTASGAATAVESYWIRAIAITGPPPLATVGDVIELFGPVTPAQESLIGALLRRASELIRGTIPDLDAKIVAGTLKASLVALAAVNMVMRVIRNPRNLRSETVGPFTRTFDTSAAGGLLELTAADLALLTPKTNKRKPASTIYLRPGLAPYPYGIRGVYRSW
jgi:hypothetical protein